jgi:hypothetical protein
MQPCRACRITPQHRWGVNQYQRPG